MNELNLYQLGNQYQKLFHELYDHETGEVNEEVDARLNEIAETSEKKCIAVANYIQSLEGDKIQIEHMKEQLTARQAAYDKRINSMNNYLHSSMERCGITEVKNPFFTIKLKKNPYSTEIIDASLIPERFMRRREIVKVNVTIDKNAIKEEVLATGNQIPGVNVSQKIKLEIRTDKI